MFSVSIVIFIGRNGKITQNTVVQLFRSMRKVSLLIHSPTVYQIYYLRLAPLSSYNADMITLSQASDRVSSLRLFYRCKHVQISYIYHPPQLQLDQL